jgi:K+/H+ antiporter YhaU regulatory subunit KhtT
MAAIITVILILVISILITRVASIALTQTGLSRESAKFQARSAFTGVGFTTDESEKVVNHPVRRRILLLLMILGNAGIVTGIASLIIGFSGLEGNTANWIKMAILVGGIIILWSLANSKWVDRQLSNVITRILKKHGRLDVNDYASLLQLSGEFRISEIPVGESHWLLNKKLKNTRLRDEGLNVLAISRRDGTFLGAPGGDTTISDGDSLIIYGRASALSKLEKRIKGTKGNREHSVMIKKQKQVEKKEREEDTVSGKK